MTCQPLRPLVALALLGALGCTHQPTVPPPPDSGGLDAGPADAGPPDGGHAAAWLGKSIYFVLTDRFADGDPTNNDANGYPTDLSDGSAWHGGDLKGLADHLDYVRGMGFDAIWITPVVTQHHPHGYHGYWGWDWYTVDGHLGTMDDLQALVRKAHAVGLQVMLDTVANHTGRYNYAAPTFPDPAMYHHNGDIVSYDNQWDVENQDVSGLNDLAQENPDTARILLDHVRWLVTSSGADGLRLDTAKHVPKPFLAQFTAAAGVFVIGEVYQGDPVYAGDYTRYLDAVLDYPMYYSIKDVFGHDHPMTDLSGRYGQDSNFQDPRTNGVFIDNHDQARFLCDAQGDATEKDARLRLALLFQFTSRGLPVLYYGTEQGFSGCSDPANREDLFNARDTSAPLYGYIAHLNAARAANPALRTGTQREVLAQSDAYAYVRKLDSNAVLVVLNKSASAQTLRLSGLYGFADGHALYDELAGALSGYAVQAGSVEVTVPPRAGLVLSNRP